MKASLFAVLALGVAAGTASAAQPRIAGFEPLSAGNLAQTRASNSVVFSAIPGPYAAFGAAAAMGFDDYDTTLAGGNAFLQSMRFVGGVVVAGGSITIDFYDSTLNLVNSATIGPFPAGISIYNITFESALNAKDSTFLIPDAGFIDMNTVGAATGQWFLGTALPTVGTESRALGSTTTHSHRFELTVPAPSALALLGLGGLVATRRRR